MDLSSTIAFGLGDSPDDYASVSTASCAEEILHPFEPFGPYLNWLAISYDGGLYPDPLPIQAEVTPLSVVSGLLKFQTQGRISGT